MKLAAENTDAARTTLQLAVIALIAFMAWSLVATRFVPAQAPTVEQLLPAGLLDEARTLRARFGGDKDGVLVKLPPDIDRNSWKDLLDRLNGIEGITPSVCLPAMKLAEQVAADASPVFCTDDEGTPPGFIALRLLSNPASIPPDPLLTQAVEGILSATLTVDQADKTQVYGQHLIRAGSWSTARDDLRRIAPLLALIVIVLPLVVFRTLAAPTFVLVTAAFTTTMTVLISDLLLPGGFNSLLLIVVPVIWAVATMDAVHLVDRVQNHRARSRPRPVHRAIRELAGPCGITTLTTTIGFGALALQNSSPLLRSFGIAAAMGTVLAIAVTFTLARLFLTNSAASSNSGHRPEPLVRLSLGLVASSSRHPVMVTTTWVVLTATATPFALSVSVQSPFPDVFVSDHPLSETTRNLQHDLGTDLRPLTLYLVPEGESGKDPGRLLHAVAAIAHYLGTIEETRLVLPALSGESLESLKAEPARVREIADGWYDEDSGSARLEVHFSAMSLSRHQEIMDWMVGFDRSMLDHHRLVPDGVGYQYPLAERLGLDGAVTGMVWSFVGVLLCLIVALRQLRRILPAVLATALPLWLLVGLMGLLDIQWSLALLAVPAMLFGLAVDDSVHLLWIRRPGEHLQKSLRRNALTTGAALTTTTLLLCLCVALLGLSGLQANRDIALLLPAGMAIALAADLSLLPAIVSLMRRRPPR